jgi:two-component system, LytTR family, sensor kinase
MSREKPYSDLWVMIIGIPVIGVVFPFFLGLRFGDESFYRWILISFSTTLVSWLATRLMVILLWDRFTWERNPLLHIISEIGLFLIFGFLTVAFTTLLYILIFKPRENAWYNLRYIRNGILVLYAMILLVYEIIHLFFKWKKELTHAADLEKEHMRSKFEALKNHVNPHFLFNSLGTLSSLIRSDPEKAEKYVDEFSGIYRYFLEVNNNDVVTLAEELDFMQSYVFLQQIRLGNGFSYDNRVNEHWKKALLLPLTLQVLVENALKHNATLVASPLRIAIYTDDAHEMLVIENNLQPRKDVESTGTGLLNLEQRYKSFFGKSIVIEKTDRYFRVEIPLIQQIV